MGIISEHSSVGLVASALQAEGPWFESMCSDKKYLYTEEDNSSWFNNIIVRSSKVNLRWAGPWLHRDNARKSVHSLNKTFVGRYLYFNMVPSCRGNKPGEW